MTDPAPQPATSPSPGATEVRLAQYTLLVRCAAGHSVSGLFILFRPKRPTGSAPIARVCDVIDQENVDEGDCFDGHFYLGMVGRSDDCLELVYLDNPWRDFYLQNNPHTVKLSKFQKYEGCYLRHPDAAFAQRFGRYLAAGENAAEFQSWGTRAALVQELPITFDAGQLKLQVPEDPEAFHPKGSDRYGKWVLYRDMPHQTCTAVVQKVEALQVDLARLRYPVGSQESPFAPVARAAKPSPDQNKGVFDGKVQACVTRFQENSEEGAAYELKSVAMGIAQGGNAYAQNIADPLPRADKEFPDDRRLAGHCLGVVDEPTGTMIGHWIADGLRKPGAVLLPMSRSIGVIWMLGDGAIAAEAWNLLCKAFGTYGLVSGHSFRNVLDKGAGKGKRLNSIHKTGLALDFTGGATARTRTSFPIRFEAHWMRNDKDVPKKQAAVTAAEKSLADKTRAEQQADTALQTAQSGLATAQAKKAADLAAQPPASRTVLAADDKAITAAQKRVTTTTTARDRAAAATSTARTKLDTARDELRVAQEAARTDEAGAKEKWKVRWRLYAHSPHDYFGDATQLTALRGRLLNYGGDLLEHFVEKFGGVPRAEVEAWISPQLAEYERVGASIFAMTDAQIKNDLLRQTVNQWIYNHYEVDGGSASPEPWPPTKSTADFPPPPFAAKSYVNITALGAMCGLARIGGSRVRDASVTAAGKVNTAQFGIAKSAGTIAQLLVYLKTLPDGRHANDPITIIRAKARLTPTYKPADIDAEFMKDWTEAIPGMGPQNNSEIPFVAFSGLDVSTTFAATAGAGETAAKRVFTKIGSFGDKKFLVVAAGPLTGVTAGTLSTGSALKTTLDTALARFKVAAKAPPEPGVKQPSERKRREDWSVSIRPAFVAAANADAVRFAPADSVELPAPSSSNLGDLWRPLEWWHYQHDSAAGVEWGDLLELCGLSQAVLKGVDWEAMTDGSAPPAGATIVFPRGVGYHPDNFPDSSGGTKADRVENRDDYTPTGG